MQYVGIISTLNSKLATNDDKLASMEKKLEVAMATLEKSTKTVDIVNNNDNKSSISSLLSIDSSQEVFDLGPNKG